MNQPKSNPPSIFRSPRRRHDRQFFYKYMTAEVAKIVLVTRKLRWSSPRLFNDPFDVNQEIPRNFNIGDLHLTTINTFASFIETGNELNNINHHFLSEFLHITGELTPGERKSIANEFRQIQNTDISGLVKSQEELDRMWKFLVSKLRILCLSENNDIAPMWLHYADAYKGVVLEYSAVDALDSVFLVARPVKYLDSPRIADKNAWINCLLCGGVKEFLQLITEYQYTKIETWSYENEWRIVDLDLTDGNRLYNDSGFNPLELTGVYFGPLCSSESKSDLHALLSHGLKHVKVYDGCVSTHQTKITFREHSPDL